MRLLLPKYNHEDIDRFVSKSVLIVFFIGVAVLPLVVIPGLQNAQLFSKVVILYIISGILLVFNLIKIFWGSKPRKTELIVLPVFLFIIVQLISATFSPAPLISFWGNYGKWANGVVQNLCYFIIFLSALNCIEMKSVSKIRFGVYLGSLVVFVFSVISTMFLENTAANSGGRISATFANPIYLSIYVVMVVSMLTGELFKKDHTKKEQAIFVVMLLLNLITLYLSMTRAAILVYIVTGLITLIMLAFKERVKIMGLLKYIGIVLIASLVVVGLSFAFEGSRTRIMELFSRWSPDSSMSVRINEQIAGLKVVKDKWLIGTGPDLIFTEVMKYKPISFNLSETDWQSRPSNIRSMFIEIFATSGIFGILAYISLIAFYLRKLYFEKSLWWRDNLHLILLINSFLVYMLLYYQTIESAFLFWFALGAIFCSTSISNNKKKYYSLLTYSNLLKLLTVIVMVTIMVIQITKIVAADVKFGKALELDGLALQEIALTEVYENNPNVPDYLRQLSYTVYAQLVNLMDNQTAFNEVMNKALSYVDKAVALNPNDSVTLSFSGTMYYNLYLSQNKIDDLNTSIDYHKASVKLDPNNPFLHDQLGLAYLAGTNYGEALSEFEKAKSLKDNYYSARLHIAEVYIQTARYDEAISELEYVRNNSTDNTQIKMAVEKMKEVLEKRAQ